MATVEPGGYEVLPFEDRRIQVVDLWKEHFSPDSDTASETPDGLIIDVLTKMAVAVDERGSEAYQAAFFTTAVGLQLDGLLRPLFNSERAPDRGSAGTITVYGDLGTTIPAAAEASTTGRGDVYVVDTAVELEFGTIAVVVFGPATGAPTTTSITIAGTPYFPAGVFNGTGIEVAANQLASMPASDANIVSISDAFEDPAGNGVLVIQLTGFLSVVSTAGASTVADFRGSTTTVTSEEPGAIPGDAFTITTIGTPISGWEGVANLDTVTPGALEDTDAQYRARHLATLGKNGAGTILSLLGQLRDIRLNPGVESVEVYNNFTSVMDANGLPPHSFEVVIKGGDADTIAKIVWEDHQLGIESFGFVTKFIQDPRAAGTHRIRFSRVVERHVWADVDIVAGEGFPPDEISDIEAAVSNDLVTFGDTLGVGKDVYIDVLKQKISLDGAESITISLGTRPLATDPKPALVAANIDIDEREISIWDLGKIAVTVT